MCICACLELGKKQAIQDAYTVYLAFILFAYTVQKQR